METSQSEAERWFARLRASDCTAGEGRELDAWVATDTAHASAYARTRGLRSALDRLADDSEVAQWRRDAH